MNFNFESSVERTKSSDNSSIKHPKKSKSEIAYEKFTLNDNESVEIELKSVETNKTLLEIASCLEAQTQVRPSSIIIFEEIIDSQLSGTNSDSEINILDGNDLPALPITTVADFKHLNRICNSNTELAQKLQDVFLKLPSDDLTLRKWCEINLSSFLMDTVANQFSWYGSNRTPSIKEPVYNGKTIQILIHCAELKYGSCMKSDTEQCIRWWFARSSLRMAIANSKEIK